MTVPSRPAWSLESDAVLAGLEVDLASGLSGDEAARRLEEHGPNTLRRFEPRSVWNILWCQLRSVIVLLLVVAAALSAAFGDLVEVAAIAAVLVLNTGIGFLTELRAARSMEALRELGTVNARVRRGGADSMIPAQLLVPGDIVLFEGGDVVTADVRVLEASKLEADESILTGESVPVTKVAAPVPADAAVADRGNMLHKGTAVTRGSACGAVVATGMRTELGRIASLVAESEDEVTPLERRLDRLGRRLVVVAFAVAAMAAVAGILSGRDALLMVKTGVALAVAAIPEGLPVVATMALARGMWRLARRNAHIRRLAAVETLGATNIILVDKTGTLTENRMTVTRLVFPELGAVEVRPDEAGTGSFHGSGGAIDPAATPALRLALELGALCGNATLVEDGGEAEAVGDPLEVALLVAAAKAGLRRDELLARSPEVREEAFDADVRMMATFHREDGALRVAVKGAVEAVVAVAASERVGEVARPLDDAARRRWFDRNEALAKDGLRVVAVATKQARSEEDAPYEGLELVALVGMHDPPRAGVSDAIAACREAGVRVVMATGDQVLTARTIALAVGLVPDDSARAVRGVELAAALERGDFREPSIFARVDPAQKLSLVKAYQAAGDVVAMTGDGVNDAPALARADIGVAMGKRGTQVAREAADMVLRDDSFASIVVAIRQGRVIYENIRKFVLYLLSCNLAEIGVIALATVFAMPLPLLPLQILFLNLVTDVFPALALGFGEGDRATMRRPPRDAREPLLKRAHWKTIVIYGVVIAASVLLALAAATHVLGYGPSRAVGVSFLTLGFAQLWHVFNVRTPGSTFLRNDVVTNPWVWGALALCALMLVATVLVPGAADVLRIEPPGAAGWLLILGFSLVPWGCGQLALQRRRPAVT